MSLTQAIDDLLAFVHAYVDIPLRQRPPFDASRFRDLDRAVYLGAVGLDLSGHMPQPKHGETLKPFGHTNLPGFGGTQHDPPGYFEPMPSQIPQWRNEMQTLRDFAELAERASAGHPSDQGGAKRSEEAGTDGDRDEGRINPSPLQIDILDALRALKATNREKRATGEQVAKKVGGDATEQSVKAPLADLKRKGLVDSITGRKGGSWLTPQGLDRINSLRPKQ